MIRGWMTISADFITKGSMILQVIFLIRYYFNSFLQNIEEKVHHSNYFKRCFHGLGTKTENIYGYYAVHPRFLTAATNATPAARV